MDIQMQPIDGLMTARRIRELSGHADTPIIAITRHALVEDRERCFALGMDDFIAKPFQPELLYATLPRGLGASAGLNLA